MAIHLMLLGNSSIFLCGTAEFNPGSFQELTAGILQSRYNEYKGTDEIHPYEKYTPCSHIYKEY